MKKTHFVTLMFATTALVACGTHHEEVSTEEVVTGAPVDGPARIDPAKPASTEPGVDVERLGQEGTSNELVDALKNQKPDEPIYVVLRPGTKIEPAKNETNGHVVAEKEEHVGRALRLEGDPNAPNQTIVVELLLGGVDVEAKVALTDVRYLKTIDLAYIGQESERVVAAAVIEIDDFDIDEAARRAAQQPQQPLNGLDPAVAPDFDCIARFAKISPSRDFLPFPLTNCSAPQDPVGDPERIADAVKAKQVAQNIFNQQVTNYNNAQAMIAALNARLVAIQNAYVFIRHDPHFKEYNVLHFKKFIHGKKSYNDRFKRAEALLIAGALATQAQIAVYAQVPPPNAALARSDANRIVARKWNCVLKQGLLNNGGRSGTTIVGVSLETVGAPFVDIQVMLDDHPPLPQKDGWGGLFDVGVTANLPSDVTRFPVASFVPITASAGLPIVMFRFQPLDAKKTRPVGKACNLRAGIVL